MSRRWKKRQSAARARGLVTLSVEVRSPEDAIEVRVPPGGAVIARELGRAALAARIGERINAFEYEVCGESTPTELALVIGSEVCAQLWERYGTAATWAQLDVDALLNRHHGLPRDLQLNLYVFLVSLVTWLANNGQLENGVASSILARLQRREPAEVAAMRAAVAALPGSELARFERRRLARLEKPRGRGPALN